VVLLDMGYNNSMEVKMDMHDQKLYAKIDWDVVNEKRAHSMIAQALITLDGLTGKPYTSNRELLEDVKALMQKHQIRQDA